MDFYDPRPAHRLANARNKPKGKRMCARKFNVLKLHASYAATFARKAKCIRFKKRNARSEWLLPDGQRIVLAGGDLGRPLRLDLAVYE